MKILLPVNILEHILAVVFFAGLALALWGMVIKKEYQEYKFSFWDVLFLILVVLTVQSFWYTLATPHPLFHDRYFI